MEKMYGRNRIIHSTCIYNPLIGSNLTNVLRLMLENKLAAEFSSVTHTIKGLYSKVWL